MALLRPLEIERAVEVRRIPRSRPRAGDVDPARPTESARIGADGSVLYPSVRSSAFQQNACCETLMKFVCLSCQPTIIFYQRSRRLLLANTSALEA